jgi:hypothetical protein
VRSTSMTSSTIPPRGADPRELGIRVFNLFVDPR